MSNYVRVYNLTVKDSLPTGDSGKVIKGTELDVELNAVAAAISSKSDSNSPTFTGTPVAPTATYGTNTTQLATTAFVQQALQAVYPVGSVYINASSETSPATLLGFGTWTAIGAGKVLVGQDTSDTLFDVLGDTGGSKNAIAVSHTHTASSASAGAHTHSVTDPGHTHTDRYSAAFQGSQYNDHSGQDSWDGTVTGTTSSATTGISIVSGGAHTHSVTVDSAGSSGTNANLPPFLTVKMWQRTA